MPSSIANDPARRAARLEVQGGVGSGGLVAALVVMVLLFTMLIGTLAAIAIPAYQDYTIRAQVTEGLNLAGPIKAEVAEFYAQNDSWPEQADIGGELPSGQYVDKVMVKGGRCRRELGGRLRDPPAAIFPTSTCRWPAGQGAEWGHSSFPS